MRDPNEHFDHTVLDLIEHSPIGAVPATPAYQDALKRLHAAHQVYADADHRDGHVTARSLAGRPRFHARNLGDYAAGRIESEALESNAAIFERYLQTLPAERRPAAEARRLVVAGRPVHHRTKHGAVVGHDPVHSLFLVPGAGPHPGLPGNYLYGSVYESGTAPGPWALNVHDSDTGAAWVEVPSLPEAFAKLQEVLESAPFNMNELEALGFRPM
jgi:hypothetical protein